MSWISLSAKKLFALNNDEKYTAIGDKTKA
jgi:hypothetical protein